MDGLIPFHKTEYSYNDPPNQVIRREYTFEWIQKTERGVFIIDFFGNAISSRAIFYKGKLFPLFYNINFYQIKKG